MFPRLKTRPKLRLISEGSHGGVQIFLDLPSMHYFKAQQTKFRVSLAIIFLWFITFFTAQTSHLGPQPKHAVLRQISCIYFIGGNGPNHLLTARTCHRGLLEGGPWPRQATLAGANFPLGGGYCFFAVFFFWRAPWQPHVYPLIAET